MSEQASIEALKIQAQLAGSLVRLHALGETLGNASASKSLVYAERLIERAIAQLAGVDLEGKQ